MSGLFGSSRSGPGPGLSISTSAGNTSSSPFGTQPSQSQQNAGGLFGSSNASSQPQQGGGLFGTTNQQPQQNLFGAASGATSQSQPSSNIFGNLGASASQPQQQPTLFGNTLGGSSQPQQTSLFGGLQGGSTSQSGTMSLFNNNTSGGTSQAQQQQSGSIFGNGQPTQQQTQQSGSGIFGTFGQPKQQTSQPGTHSLFYNPVPSKNQSTTMGLSNFQQPGPTTSGGTKIDQDHLRRTTKWDHLTDDLAQRVTKADDFILETIGRCNEVSDLLPAIGANGKNLPNDVAFVTSKLEQLESGLENDAADIEALRLTSKRDVANARVIFRGVDRLKMPLQYQQAANGDVGSAYATGGGGWWNNPQTLQRTARTNGVSSRSIQLPGDGDENEPAGPANLIDFFNTRTDEMADVLEGFKGTLRDIEQHLGGVEESLMVKQREIRNGGGGLGGNAEEQLRRLKATLEVFETGIVGVAGKVADAQGKVAAVVAKGSGGSTMDGTGNGGFGRYGY